MSKRKRGYDSTFRVDKHGNKIGDSRIMGKQANQHLLDHNKMSDKNRKKGLESWAKSLRYERENNPEQHLYEPKREKRIETLADLNAILNERGRKGV